jgi:hypothetical protein
MAKRIRTISLNLDPNSDGRRNLDASLGEVILNIQKLNTIEGVNLGQLQAELQAGSQYVKAPKAKKAILDELLAKPMRQIARPPFPMNLQNSAAKFLDWYRLATRER